MDETPPAPARATSWRPRFSLRTLVLATLALGSGGTLWHNWCPWTVAWAVDAPFEIQDVHFSDDDQFVMFHYRDETDPDKPANLLEIRYSGSGKVHAVLRDPDSYGDVEVAGDYAMLTPEQGPNHRRLFNLKTGQELKLLEKLNAFGVGSFMSAVSRNFCLLTKSQVSTVFSLPDFKPIQSVEGSIDVQLELNDKLYFVRDQRLEVYDLQTGHSLKTPPFKGELLANVHFCEKTILYEVEEEKGEGDKPGPRYVHACDATTGALLLKTKSILASHTRDGTRLLFVDFIEDTYAHMLQLPSTQEAARLPQAARAWLKFSADDALIYGNRNLPCPVYDAKTLEKLWERPEQCFWFSGNGKVFVIVHDGRFLLVDSRSGTQLLDLGESYWQSTMVKYPEIVFANHSLEFVVRSWGRRSLTEPEVKHVSFIGLRRPWQWYGLAWLPEFWLALITTLAFFWSVLADRKWAAASGKSARKN